MLQKYCHNQRGGIPEIEALIRDLQVDGAFSEQKIRWSHITTCL